MAKPMVALSKSRIYGAKSVRLIRLTNCEAASQNVRPFRNIFAKLRAASGQLDLLLIAKSRPIRIFRASESTKNIYPVIVREGQEDDSRAGDPTARSRSPVSAAFEGQFVAWPMIYSKKIRPSDHRDRRLS